MALTRNNKDAKYLIYYSKCKSFVKHLLRRDLSKRYGNLKNGTQDIKGHRFYEKINW